MEAKNNRNRIPENDPSKAMDSKREVEQSNDEKIGQDFPGYPHYPAKEDIMDQRTDVHRVDMDVENLASGPNKSGLNQRFADETDRQHHLAGEDRPTEDLESLNDEIGTPQNITNEELGKEQPGTDLDQSKRHEP